MNKELLLKVKEQILAEPKQFDMGTFIHVNPTNPACGTTACIAGWACAIELKKKPYQVGNEIDYFIEKNATQYLNLHWEQSDRLFYCAEWPTEFFKHYSCADTKEQRARIAAERIDHFIATNGAE